jgi:hypothetical protein
VGCMAVTYSSPVQELIFSRTLIGVCPRHHLTNNEHETTTVLYITDLSTNAETFHGVHVKLNSYLAGLLVLFEKGFGDDLELVISFDGWSTSLATTRTQHVNRSKTQEKQSIPRRCIPHLECWSRMDTWTVHSCEIKDCEKTLDEGRVSGPSIIIYLNFVSLCFLVVVLAPHANGALSGAVYNMVMVVRWPAAASGVVVVKAETA